MLSGATPTGTATEYEEGIDIDQTHLNGIEAGNAMGDGGVNSINPLRLVRDPANSCNPVFPWNFVRTNTVFGVIHKAGMYTAWSDKHPAYASVSGPGPTASNIDDFYGPEINSLSSNFETDNDIPVKFLNCCPNLPDQLSVAAGDDYTGSFQNIQCYDAIKVQAILNEIDGKTHNASGPAPMPNILGMNFQAVSVGQKLVYQDGAVAPVIARPADTWTEWARPAKSLAQEIAFVDNVDRLMVTELSKKHMLDSTLIIITAKHGQSPIDPNRVLRIHGDVPTDKSPTAILGPAFIPISKISGLGPTEDDVSLLWLKDSSQTAAAVALLETDSPVLPRDTTSRASGEIFWGASILPMFNPPGLRPNCDPRTPDIIVTPNVGVIYTGHQAKVAEHGGFANDDTNVIMLLSNPHFKAKTVVSPVETTQVAPTILAALGLDPRALEAVQIEGTQVLPGVQFSCAATRGINAGATLPPEIEPTEQGRAWPSDPGRARRSLYFDQAVDVAARARASWEYSIDLRVGKLHVRSQHRRDWFAEVGRHREVALLVEARGREARPSAVNLAAFHRAAHHPHHVAVAVIGAAVAVLMHRAAELGNHQDDGVLVVRPQRLREARESLAERLQMSRELAVGGAFVDVRIPAAERHERDANRRIAPDQTREAVGVVGESLRRRRAGVGLRHILREFAHQPHARLASVAIRAADRIVADVHLVERRFDHRPVHRHRPLRGATERDIRDRHLAAQNPRHRRTETQRLGRRMRPRNRRQRAIQPSVLRRF